MLQQEIFKSENRKKIFYHGDSQTLEQATQRGCEISTAGDIQSVTGQGSEQSDLSCSCLDWRIGQDDLWKSLST